MTEILTENYPGYATVKKLFDRNPELKKRFKIKRILFALNEQQRNELLDISENQNHKHYVMIKTQLECGLRVGEIANLIIPNTDLINNVIEIKAIEKSDIYKAWHPKTTAGQRPVPMTPDLKKNLRILIGKRKEGYIFESRKGHKRLWIQSIINMVDHYAIQCKSIGKVIGTHALRRTYASYLINDGMEIGHISKLMGHADIKTTMLYLYDIVDLDFFGDVRKSISKMNRKRENEEI